MLEAIAASIAERLYTASLTKEEYLNTCRIQGMKVAGMKLTTILQAATAYWDR